MRWRGMLGALGERPFRLLWIGQTASAVGDGVIPVALAWAVLDLTHSAGKLGLVLASYSIARVSLILVGGVWADRLPRQLVMLAADVARCAAQGAVAILLLSHTARLWQLVALAFVAGAGAAFFTPAAAALVPETVSAGRLQQANALMNVSGSLFSIVGPAIGGLLVALVGAGWVFAVDSASFAVSAFFLFLLRVPRATRQRPQSSFMSELADGWREIRTRSWLWSAMIVFSITNISVAAFFVLGPFVAKRDLGPAAWGAILAAGGIGGLLGGLVGLRFEPRRPLIWSFMIVMPVGLQLAVLGPPAPTAVIALAAVAGFFGIALGNTLWLTVIQERIPADRLSRVNAYDWLVSLVFMPVGFALAGPLAQSIGLDETVYIIGGVGAAANLSILLVPAVRRLERLPHPPAAPVSPGPDRGPTPDTIALDPPRADVAPVAGTFARRE
jgi:MFS family permease